MSYRNEMRVVKQGLLGLGVALTVVALAAPAWGNPTGGTVAAGEATITTAPGMVRVEQRSDRAIINWQDFSIGRGELTEFVQPSASAIALNRVVGPDPSAILGNLTANGRVWLINPNGIVFGRDARVDVAGLLATTHDIRDADFLAGRYAFRGDPSSVAAIENLGRITVRDAGMAAFVAPGVENHGLISARLGSVTLASGNRFTLDFYGDQRINLFLDEAAGGAPVRADGSALEHLVNNTGGIFADGGQVLITAAAARGVVDSVINVGGVVEARSVEERNGRIVLAGGDSGTVTVSGALDARGLEAGATGGSVQVLGERVELADGAVVDVSGLVGGGMALIGGSFRGGAATAADWQALGIGAPPVLAGSNARFTRVAEGAAVHADALGSGRGGLAVIWADDSATVRGLLTARGAGTVETSARHGVDFSGITVDTTAPGGGAGLWLLDPTNLTIDQAYADTIATNLATTNFTAETAAAGGQSGDITWAAGVTLAPVLTEDRELKLVAHRNISILQGATIDANGGALTVILNANRNANESTLGEGRVNIGVAGQADVTIRTNGGNLVIGGGTCTATGCDAYAATATQTGRSMEIRETVIATGGGDIHIRGKSTKDGHSSNRANVILDSTITTGGGDLFFEGVGTGVGATGGTIGLNMENTSIDSGAGDMLFRGDGSDSGTNSFDIIIGGSTGMSLTTQGDLTFELNGSNGSVDIGNSGSNTFNGGSDSILTIRPQSTTASFGACITGSLECLSDVVVAQGFFNSTGFAEVVLGHSGTVAATQLLGQIRYSAPRLTLYGNGITVSDSPHPSLSNHPARFGQLQNDRAGGNVVVVAGSGNFVNNGTAGANTLKPGSGGRWFLYSDHPSNTTLGGLVPGFNRYNCAFGGSCPAMPASGNGVLYRHQPTLTITPNTRDVVYGSAVSLDGLGYTVNGYLSTTDRNEAGNLTGTALLAFSGTAPVQGDPVGFHDVAYMSGLASSQGYLVADDATSTGEFGIDPRKLTLTGVAGVTRVYDGTTGLPAGAGDGYLFDDDSILGSDEVSLGLGTVAFDSRDAGNRTVVLSGFSLTGADSGNYALEIINGSGTITKRSLAVTGASGVTRVYDGTTAMASGVLGYSFDDTVFVMGDDVDLTGAAVFDSSNAGTRTISLAGLTLTGMDAGNYDLSVSAGAGSISKLTVAVVGDSDVERVYDGTTAMPSGVAGYSFDDVFVVGDDVALSGQAVFDSRNAGERVIDLSGLSLTGADKDNYTLTLADGDGTITRKMLALTGATGVTRVYDGTTAMASGVLGYSFDDTVFVMGDDVELAGAAVFDSKNVGNDRVVDLAGLSLDGDDAGNYDLTFTNGSGSITPRAIVLTAATGITRVYDGSDLMAEGESGFSFDDSLFVETDDIGFDGHAVFDSDDVGDRVVDLSGISLAGADMANYTLDATDDGSGTITRRAIVATGAIGVTREPNGTTALPAGSLGYAIGSGQLIEGDDIQIVGSAVFDSHTTGPRVIDLSALALAGTDAGNYELTTVNGSGAIAVAVTRETILTTILRRIDERTGGEATRTGGRVLGGLVALPPASDAPPVATLPRPPETAAPRRQAPKSVATAPRSAPPAPPAPEVPIARRAPGPWMADLDEEQVPLLTPSQLKTLPPELLEKYAGDLTADQWKSLDPKQVAELPGEVLAKAPAGTPTSQQIASLSPKQVAALDVGSLTPQQTGKLSPEQLGGLSPGQIGQLPPGGLTAKQIPALDPGQVAGLSRKQIESLTTSQTAALTGAQLEAMSPEQVSWLPVTGLTPEQLRALSREQVAALTPEQTRALTGAQLAAFTPEQMPALDVAVLAPAALAKLSPRQAAALTPGQIETLSEEQRTKLAGRKAPAAEDAPTPKPAAPASELAKLLPPQIARLSLEKVAGLTPSDAAGLSGPQLGALTVKQLAVLGSDALAALSREQVAALSKKQIAALTPDQLAAVAASLSPEQAGGLGAEQLAGLGPEAVAKLPAAGLTPSQIGGLTPAQAKALTPAQIGSLSNGQLGVLRLDRLTAEQFAGLTPDQLGALQPGQMATLTAEQIATLSGDRLRALSTEALGRLDVTKLSPEQVAALPAAALMRGQILALSGEQIKAFTAEQVKTLSADQLAWMSPSQLAALTAEQLAVLDAKQLDLMQPYQLRALPATMLPPAQLARLAPEDIAALSDSQLGALSGAQIQALTPWQLRALSPQQVAVLPMSLTPAQLRSLTPEQLAGLTPAQLAGMSKEQIAVLPLANLGPQQLAALDPAAIVPEQIARLTPDQFAALPVSLLGALTPEQLKYMSPQQFEALSADQVAALPVAALPLTKLSPQQIAALPLERIPTLRADQIASLSPEQFGALTPAQLATLKPEQWAWLSRSLLQTLSPTQLQGLPTETVASLRVDQIYALKPAQFASFTPAQLSAMSPDQLKWLPASTFKSLSGAQMAALPPGAVPVTALSPEQIAEMPPAQVAQLPDRQIRSLSEEQLQKLPVKGMTESQLGNLDARVLKTLLPFQLATLSAEQAAALSVEQLKTLSPTQVRALNVAEFSGPQLQVLPGSALPVRKMEPEQLAQLTPQQKGQLTSAQIKAMTPEQIAAMGVAGLSEAAVQALSPEQLAALKPEQYNNDIASKMSPEQFKRIPAAAFALGYSGIRYNDLPAQALANATTEQRIAMGNNAELRSSAQYLSADQIRALYPTGSSSEMLAGMIPWQKREAAIMTPDWIAKNGLGMVGAEVFKQFGTEQIKAITPQQLKGAPNHMFASMTASQMAAMSPDQLRAITSEQVYSIPTSVLLSLSPEQMAMLPADIVNRVPEDKKHALLKSGKLSEAQVRAWGSHASRNENYDQLIGQLPAETVQKLSRDQLVTMAQTPYALDVVANKLSKAQWNTLDKHWKDKIDPAFLSDTAKQTMTASYAADPNNLRPSDLWRLDDNFFSSASADVIAKLRQQPLLGHLSDHQMKLVQARYDALEKEKFKNMSAADLKNVQGIKLIELSLMHPEVLASRAKDFSAIQVRDMPGEAVVALLPGMTAAQIAGVDPSLLAQQPLGDLSGEQLRGLTYAQVEKILQTQGDAAFTVSQWGALSPDVVSKLMAKGKLSTRQIAGLLPSMSPDTIAAMPLSQLREAARMMPAASVKQLSGAQLEKMGKHLYYKQVKQLSSGQVAAAGAIGGAMQKVRDFNMPEPVDAPVAGYTPSSFMKKKKEVDDAVGMALEGAEMLADVVDAGGYVQAVGFAYQMGSLVAGSDELTDATNKALQLQAEIDRLKKKAGEDPSSTGGWLDGALMSQKIVDDAEGTFDELAKEVVRLRNKLNYDSYSAAQNEWAKLTDA